MGTDFAQEPDGNAGASRAPHGTTLAEPVFASLLADWSRHVRGGITAADLTGAAVTGCVPGTGWPLRTTA